MFGWFQRKKNLDIYQPKERNIYKYFDGNKTIHADPAVLYRRLMDKAPEIKSDMDAATFVSAEGITSKFQEKARVNLFKRISEVFQVKQADPFKMDEGGLSEEELSELLFHFLVKYCGELKKNSSKSLTSLIPSEVSKPSSKENQPTKNSSVSGSTEKESSFVGLGL